ncbi:MAG: N-6 DNA methylase [Acidobacteriota bacterium]|nr:N-6 DNA methylase [Acidobacteriota bacterium]
MDRPGAHTRGKQAGLPLAQAPDGDLAERHVGESEWSTPAILDDARWKHGTPPPGNANYAWIQHFLAQLAPDGRAGFVMANGSLTTMTSGGGKIREGLARADVVDCIVALPAQLF